jgi:S-DNA-T family DNA segregation ATPase FtsK/SpoIIIE
MIGAVVIGLVVGSPFMLLFAALGPVVAVASAVDARRTARRHDRLEAERFEHECSLFERAVHDAHDRERREAELRHPVIPHRTGETREGVRIGRAPAPSAVAPDVAVPLGDTDSADRLRRMLAHAQRNPDLPALIARGLVVLDGGGLVADGLARRLAREPGVTVYRRDTDHDLPPHVPAHATVLTVLSATALEVRDATGAVWRVRPEFVTERQSLQNQTDASPPNSVPDAVSWSSVQAADPTEAANDGIPIGIGESGVVTIDLIGSGPHALIGGTTGSGKSELLRSLALGWAAAFPPTAAQILFVDFKGGATFAGLTDLPHAVGLVTDLDPVIAQRALRALRAELQHRERTLAEAGVRDIREVPGLLPRLLVLVDEFATLASTFPDLHGVFADLAARGRSLGVHLVLCTQHPASIVRDVVAANCPVRLSFRVTEAASGGIVGDRARELVSAPPGRAIMMDERGTQVLQVAVVGADDRDRVLEKWRDHPSAVRTWCDPLPDRVLPEELPHDIAEQPGSTIEQVAFGLLDDPDNRRHVPAVWRPPIDGTLAVVGASRSGRSTMLAALAQGAGARVVVLPDALPDAWSVLERLAAQPPAATLLLCDRLDGLLLRSGDRSSELLARWDSAVDAIRSAGGTAAASFAGSSAASSLVTGRFESRLVLRCADADEHVVAGGPRGLFERTAPPGRGWWHDRQAQVVDADQLSISPEIVSVPLWHPADNRDTVIIASSVADVVDRIEPVASRHRIVRELSTIDPRSIEGARDDHAASDQRERVLLDPRILIGSPAAWQAEWSLLSAARAHVSIVMIGVDASEVRAVLGSRDALPPIDVQRGECWLAEPGRPSTRARWYSVTPETNAPSAPVD